MVGSPTLAHSAGVLLCRDVCGITAARQESRLRRWCAGVVPIFERLVGFTAAGAGVAHRQQREPKLFLINQIVDKGGEGG